jgi:hypothetical protein
MSRVEKALPFASRPDRGEAQSAKRCVIPW